MENVSIKFNITIFKLDIISCMLSFPNNYYDESHDQILRLRALTLTDKFE